MEVTTRAAQTLLDEPFVKINYTAETRIVAAKWTGFLKMEGLKKGCEVLNNQIRKEKLTSHLSDQTELKVLARELQEYIGGVWFDEAEKLGLRKIGVIVAEDIFAQAAVNKVNTYAQFRKLEIQTFGSREKCMKWLTE